MYLYLFFSFFFSSRRRHTRWPRDWSSDVCSSDLSASNAGVSAARRARTNSGSPIGAWAVSPIAGGEVHRSEERRVGKECRSWRAPYEEKKNMNETSCESVQKTSNSSGQ